jgi:hypothetical protein
MSSAIEQINTLLASLSFAEKLTLNEQIAGALRKEGGGVKPVAAKGGKKSKKSSKNGDAGSDSEGDAKPKRKAAAGTLAWTAFVKHIKETQPEAFESVSKEADKLRIVKGIRAENMAAYDSFVAEWKEKYAASSEVASVAEAEEAEEAVPAPVVVAAAKPKTAAEKLAELKAAKAATAAAASAAAAAASAAAPPAAATPKKPVKTVKAEAPKKAAKATVAKATEEPQMDQVEIDGKMYWHDPGTHGLWEVTGETFSSGSSTWMGYFQPGNDEEPIRYTEAFGDE